MEEQPRRRRQGNEHFQHGVDHSQRLLLMLLLLLLLLLRLNLLPLLRAFSSPSSSPSCSPPFRIVLFGSSEFSIPSLTALLHHADVLLSPDTSLIVITPGDKPASHHSASACPLKHAASSSSKCRVITLPLDIGFKMSGWELPQDLVGQVDLGIVVSFGYMIPSQVISSFPLGMINIHPSLLPLYRGSSPIQFSLVGGDLMTGVSLIEVHEKMIDAGRILNQQPFPIPPDSTYKTLEPLLAQQGAKQLIQVLMDLKQTKEQAVLQKSYSEFMHQAPSFLCSLLPRRASRTLLSRALAPRLFAPSGCLDFSAFSSEQLHRIWRGLHGFLSTYTSFQGKRLNIHAVIHRNQVKYWRNGEGTRYGVRGEKRITPARQPAHFPSFEEAQRNVGEGGIFFHAASGLIGVVCKDTEKSAPAASSSESSSSSSSSSSSTSSASASSPNDVFVPTAFYIATLQLECKNIVPAATFMAGYCDKRKFTRLKLITPEQQEGEIKTWKFETSEENKKDEFWKRLFGITQANKPKLN